MRPKDPPAPWCPPLAVVALRHGVPGVLALLCAACVSSPAVATDLDAGVVDSAPDLETDRSAPDVATDPESPDADAQPDSDGPVWLCDPDLEAEPLVVLFAEAGDYTIANGRRFEIPQDAYSVEVYLVGGGGSSDTRHDTPSHYDNHNVLDATPGATVRRRLDRGTGTLVPGQLLEFTVGAGGADPRDTGMCVVDVSNLGERGESTSLYDPAAPGDASRVLLRAAGGGRGSYCGNCGLPPPCGIGDDSCLTGTGLRECHFDVVDASESVFDAAAGDELWPVEPHWVECEGAVVSAAVQPIAEEPGCGPGAATVAGVNYVGLVPAADGAVAFRVVPCAMPLN